MKILVVFFVLFAINFSTFADSPFFKFGYNKIDKVSYINLINRNLDRWLDYKELYGDLRVDVKNVIEEFVIQVSKDRVTTDAANRFYCDWIYMGEYTYDRNLMRVNGKKVKYKVSPFKAFAEEYLRRSAEEIMKRELEEKKQAY